MLQRQHRFLTSPGYDYKYALSNVCLYSGCPRASSSCKAITLITAQKTYVSHLDKHIYLFYDRTLYFLEKQSRILLGSVCHTEVSMSLISTIYRKSKWQNWLTLVRLPQESNWPWLKSLLLAFRGVRSTEEVLTEYSYSTWSLDIHVSQQLASLILTSALYRPMWPNKTEI
jgi:hypothetical protein